MISQLHKILTYISNMIHICPNRLVKFIPFIMRLNDFPHVMLF